jgi:hypothetical protein
MGVDTSRDDQFVRAIDDGGGLVGEVFADGSDGAILEEEV